MQSQDDYDYVQPPGWERVEPAAFADAPFEVYVNNFSSSTARSEAFLHDPRRFLMGEVMEAFGGVEGEAIKGVGPDTRIQTWITNHHRTLSRMVLYATAIVSPADDTVSLTLYKKDSAG